MVNIHYIVHKEVLFITNCKICGRSFSRNIGKHLKNTHSINLSQYYDTYYKQDKSDGQCKICGNSTDFYKLSYGYKHYCSDECKKIGVIQKFGSYNNRGKAKQTCTDKFNGKMNSGAWSSRKQHIQDFCIEHNCTPTKEVTTLYGQAWLSLNIPRIQINKQNTAISNKYLSIIAEYSNTYHNSLKQQELVDYIKTFYKGTIKQNIRCLIPSQEIDIYLPTLKLAIEFNGTRWHSIELNMSTEYHLIKSVRCREIGIRLIHIYEFEDLNKQKLLLRDLILGVDNYPKNDFNKNNIDCDIPKEPICIYKDSSYTIYGAGELI